ncbi:MAG: shikimate kinase [Candidatus Angelobacter sp.]
MRRVVLIGYMGAGKTTVGRALAARLRWKFYDLDDVIEQREGQRVSEIFAASGEAGFRRLESAALRALLQDDSAQSDHVLALGGGAFVQAQNRELLEQAGAVTILLEAPLEELRRRCQLERKARPLAQHHTQFAELFAARRADYERARFRIQTLNKAAELVATEIERLVAAEVKSEVEK